MMAVFIEIAEGKDHKVSYRNSIKHLSIYVHFFQRKNISKISDISARSKADLKIYNYLAKSSDSYSQNILND
jgi:hypothetical protein